MASGSIHADTSLVPLGEAGSWARQVIWTRWSSVMPVTLAR